MRAQYAIKDRIAPHPPVSCDWQFLVTEGHVWIARLNRLIPKAAFITACVFLALLNHDIISSTVLLSARLQSYREEPSWIQKFFLAPFALMRGAVTDTPDQIMKKNPVPKLDQKKISIGIGQAAMTQYFQLQKTDRAQLMAIVEKMRVEGGRNDESFRQLVALEIEALNKTKKMAPSIPLGTLTGASTSWYSDITASDSPVMKTGKDGAFWLGAVIVDKADGKIKPVFGVFRLKEGTYIYFNVRPSNQFFELTGYPTVQLSNIPRQVANDFPELIAANTLEQAE